MDYRGKLVELAGPGEFSWREVADLVLDTTQRARVTDVQGMNMMFARGYGMLLEQFPKPMFTEDEVGKCGLADLSYEPGGPVFICG